MLKNAKAAVFHKVGAPLTIDTFTIPKLGAGELLVEIACATICQSDLHTISGRRIEPTPSILGHEMLGTVLGVPRDEPVCDANGRPVQRGDRITWSIMASCGRCFFCNSRMEQKCTQLFKYGHQTTSHAFAGGFAQVCILRAGTTIVPVDLRIPDKVACPANCATATAAAALRIANVQRDERWLVHGAGMLGTTAIAMLCDKGSKVMATDVVEARLQTAKQFGADVTWRVVATDGQEWPSYEDCRQGLASKVDEWTAAAGLDGVIDFSGSTAAIESSIELLRTGGRLLLVGSVFPDSPVRFPADQLVRKLIRVEGIHNYRPNDLVTAVDFLTRNVDRFPFERLVDAEFPLDQINAAVQHAASRQTPRVAIRP